MGSFTWNTKANQQILSASRKALDSWTDKVAERSQQLVPIDLRPNRNNIVLKDTMLITKFPDANVISYDTDYAVEQHENLNYAHQSGKQAKFLEQAALESVQWVEQEFANKIKL